MSMTSEAQRIAIAEACGLKNVHPVIVKNVKFQGDDVLCGICSDDGWIPDYLNDLNAMHEAEKVLNSVQRGEYTCLLGDMNGVPDRADWENVPKAIRAACFSTAAQRAEAFLRTLNLWKE
jgi:hypothetical protein